MRIGDTVSFIVKSRQYMRKIVDNIFMMNSVSYVMVGSEYYEDK